MLNSRKVSTFNVSKNFCENKKSNYLAKIYVSSIVIQCILYYIVYYISHAWNHFANK